MRKFKTILAMLLALLMAFSAVGVFAEETQEATEAETAAVAAEFSDIEAGSKVEEAVQKLVAYSIISGYPDGTFKPDGQITRAEFATVIAKFKKIGTNYGTDVKTGFADLDADEQNAWARPYVKAAVDAKIINGFEDGTFRASDPVTYEQAVKMIICAIEYDVIATSEYNKLMAMYPETTTWSSGYIAAANKNGITLNAIVAQVTEPTTRGIVAILTKNALSAPKLDVGANGEVSKNENETQDNTRVEIEGYVTATPYTGVDEQNPDVDFGEIEIEEDDETEVYELAESLSESIDYHDLLGKKVTAYYSNEDDAIYQITVKESSVDSVVINQADITSIEGNEIKHENKNGKSITTNISDFTVIYNGKYMEDVTGEDLATEGGDYELKNGMIEVVESGPYELLKVSSFDVRVVNRYDKTNKTIYFKYEEAPENEYKAPAKTADRPEVVLNGKVQTFDSYTFAQYDVLNFLQSPEDAEGNTINRIYVTKGVKTGAVKEKDEESDLIKIGDVEYSLAYNYANYTGEGASGYDAKAPFEFGQNYSFYLDYTGQIAAVKYSATSSSSYKYGYIINAAEEDDMVLIKLVLENGTIENYEVKSSLKLDGAKIPDAQLLDKLSESAEEANEGYNSAAPTWEAQALDELYDGRDYYCQPVRYSISGGKIDGIDTVSTDEDNSEDKFSYDIKLADGETVVNSTSKLSQDGSSFTVNSSTKILYVPDKRNNTKDYAMFSNSTAFSVYGSTEKVNIDVFNIDSSASKLAGFIVIYENNPTYRFKDNSPFMVVTKVDGEGEYIEGYVMSTSADKQKLVISEDNFKVREAQVDEEDVVVEDAWLSIDEIDKGDVIRLFTDNGVATGENAGDIIAIQMWYDASEPAQAEPVENAEDAKSLRVKEYEKDSTTNRNLIYGMPISVDPDDKKITLTYMTTEDDADEEEIENLDYSTIYTVGSSTGIYEIDGDDVNVLETLDSINDMETSSPSRIFVVAPYADRDCTATAVYVIR